jgi:hypothetical protein
VLGLDTETLMLRWPEPATRASPQAAAPRRRIPWWSLPAGVLVVLSVWVVVEWTRRDVKLEGEPPDRVTAPAPSDAIAAEPDVVVDSPVLASPPDTATFSVPAETSGSPEPVEALAHRLVVLARDQTWIRVDADGETVHDTVLRRGDSLTATGYDELLLWATNRAWVRVRLDGERIPLPPNGDDALIRHPIPLALGDPQ